MTTMTILHRYDNGDGSGGSVGLTIGNGYVDDDDEGDEDDHGDDADSVDDDDINDGIVMVMMMVIIPS